MKAWLLRLWKAKIPAPRAVVWSGHVRVAGVFWQRVETGVAFWHLPDEWQIALLCHEFRHVEMRHRLLVLATFTVTSVLTGLAYAWMGLEWWLCPPMGMVCAWWPSYFVLVACERDADRVAASRKGIAFQQAIGAIAPAYEPIHGAREDRLQRISAHVKQALIDFDGDKHLHPKHLRSKARSP